MHIISTPVRHTGRPFGVLALAALLAAAAVAVAAQPAGAQTSAPFTAYGTGLTPGATVEARIDSKVCGDTEVDADGNWLLYIVSGGPCTPVAGNTITFRVDGKPAEGTATFSIGGAPADVANGITLVVSESTLAGGTFNAPIARGLNLAMFSGGNVEGAIEAAPNATSFWISVGGGLVGYRVGAPTFVNGPFFAAFPDGDIPANTFMVVIAE